MLSKQQIINTKTNLLIQNTIQIINKRYQQNLTESELLTQYHQIDKNIKIFTFKFNKLVSIPDCINNRGLWIIKVYSKNLLSQQPIKTINYEIRKLKQISKHNKLIKKKLKQAKRLKRQKYTIVTIKDNTIKPTSTTEFKQMEQHITQTLSQMLL